MSAITPPTTPRTHSIQKRRSKSAQLFTEDNNNTSNKFSERQQARTFIAWYKRMIDDERQNFPLYLSDDATLEWFGRTIKTRKKLTAFFKYDIQCSRHDFTTVESIDKFETRQERQSRRDDSVLARSIHSPEIISTKPERPSKRKLRSNCNSPEWADGCGPEETKKKKTDQEAMDIDTNNISLNCSNMGNKGDGIGKRGKRKCLQVTPPNPELGQGDCMPSTSADSNKSHDTLNAQLPKLAVECNGFIEFNRSKNNRTTDSIKWERKCKLQISYSVDPLNVGEYIIWGLSYTDESKCRRNLLAAFEEVANNDKCLGA